MNSSSTSAQQPEQPNCSKMTANDEAVLNAIFNPFEPNLPAYEAQDLSCTTTSSNVPSETLSPHLRTKELEAIQLAEQGLYSWLNCRLSFQVLTV
jgi:hypothetical protein